MSIILNWFPVELAPPTLSHQCKTTKLRLGFVDSLNLLEVADLDGTARDSAVVVENSGAGIRTPDTRIMIPLL
jgi:hypothetical protein